jgi:predicted Zn-dependent protease
VAARVTVAVLAVVAIAWLAVMERNVRLEARGVQAADHLVVAGNAARAEKAFRDARLLNPDTLPDLSRAYLYQARGQRGKSAALLSDIVRREPDNLTAWGVLYSLTRRSDPGTARRALAAHARLDPRAARRR